MTGAAAAVSERPLSRDSARTAILLAAVISVFLLLVANFWIGFLGSDDSLYWEGSSGWLAHFPYLGTTHWALRHTLVIPIAMARAAFGDGLPALLAPSLLYTIGVLVVIALWTRRAAGLTAAIATMALVVTNPQLVWIASVANIDVVEIFFVLSVLWLMWETMRRALSAASNLDSGSNPRRRPLVGHLISSLPALSRPSTSSRAAPKTWMAGTSPAMMTEKLQPLSRTPVGQPRLRAGHDEMERGAPPNSFAAASRLLAGVALGLAIVSRETAGFAVVAIAVLSALGFGMRRSAYLPIAIACIAVVGLDFVYSWWMSGTPFYRSSIALHHDATTNRWTDQGASVPIVHPLIDPLTMLLFNRNFGAQLWIGVPLAVWLFRRGGSDPSSRRLAVIAAVVAAVWTLFAAGLWQQLDLIPRYFLLPALLLSMLTGMALARLWERGHRRFAAALAVMVIGANLLSLSFDTRNSFMYGEHVLIDLAGRQTGLIHTDPQTLRRVELLLQWKGLASRVTDVPPASGDLFFLDPSRSDVTPGADWRLVERDGPRARFRRWLAAHLVPARLFSPAQFTKLSQGHADVTLYRLP
jgi:4-amino-4-deoxy-L-arabinose transferase-like glycosyltransferase